MAIEFSKHVKTRRTEIGLSQGQLARIVGVSRGTIRNVEGGRSMETSTLRGIVRALGWRPDSTEALLSAETMTTISQGLISKAGDDNSFELEVARATYHKLLDHVARGDAPDQSLVDDFVAQVMESVPAAAGKAAIEELGLVIVPRGTMAGQLPAFQANFEAATEKRPEGFRVAEVSGTSYAALGSTARTGRSGYAARPRAGQFTEVPPPQAQPAQRQRPDTSYPALVPVTDDIKLMIVPVSIAAEVADELSHEDLKWVFESLRSQGGEMAKGIARAKRAERLKQGFESRSEWPPMNVNTDDQGDEPDDES